jgi:MscS family membrane protein
VAWTLLRWRRELQRDRDRYAQEILPLLAEKDRLFLYDVIQKLLSISAGAILLYEVMQLVGVSAAVLITAGGFGAAAVGFGAQGIVSNSLSGLSLYVNRPFIVGDFIEIPGHQLMGTVEQIGWFYTQLRSLDRQPVYVPNTIFTSTPVVNTAAIDNRRLWIEFSVSYDDRQLIPSIVAELEQGLTCACSPMPAAPRSPKPGACSRICCSGSAMWWNVTAPRCPSPPAPCCSPSS